ncbi:KINASE FAMILY WITH LEUCINE-RICH REPEAT DOMAIN-CONTAINING PROTEIN [Salix koriyanagi]|uniref:KINASE FAMILY WITH LEUCINE-RICH REPEAT DOMAIN-CONTAINING PROTEIN n=1 Tax=Salix koriyanagi TaxID=2511006 RepID=A0A9Q0ZT77_9ROSI|nr:KINASE FAMILY WITH LEUCINE-RICH REPEAT DOMAIN-CONTAINING PROTEIN [Salix koriyanagi]
MSKLHIPFLRTPLLLCVLALLPLPFKVISQDANTEKTILLNLKQQLGNPPSIQSWNSSSLPCTWTGVTCGDDGSVTELDLGLRYIHLGANNFTGNIPPQIANLTGLRTLFLHQNQFKVKEVEAFVDEIREFDW